MFDGGKGIHEREKFMSKVWTSCAAAATVAMFLNIAPASAAMSPVIPHGVPDVQQADCAVGFQLGPAGACILGTPDHVEHDRVIENRSSDEGCETKSVKRTDASGNSETHTATNCN
jgi:hypothetical protein